MSQGISTSYDLTHEGSGTTIVRISLSETYTLETNTTDTLSVAVSVISSGYYGRLHYINGSIVINGTTIINMNAGVPTHYTRTTGENIPFPITAWSSSYTSSPWSLTKIKHDSDGAKSIDITVNLTGRYDGTSARNWSVSDVRTISLTTIPRASTISATNANIGGISTISVAKKASTFKHSIRYSFKGSSSSADTGYINASGGVSASEVIFGNDTIDFRVPNSFYRKIPDDPSGICTLTCTTYTSDGKTNVDSKNCTFRATASRDSCDPEIESCSIIDANPTTVALTGDSSVLIKNISIAACSIKANAKNSSRITGVSIGSTSLDIGTSDTTIEKSLSIPNVTSNSYAFIVTDSRGYSTTRTITKSGDNWIDYKPLTRSISVKRHSPTGTTAELSIGGDYYCGSFKYNSGVADQSANNTLSIAYEVLDGSTVIQSGQAYATIDTLGSTYSTSVYIKNVQYDKTYKIIVAISDKLVAFRDSIDLLRGIPVFDWDQDDFAFHVDVGIDNDLTVGGNLNVTGNFVINEASVSGGANIGGDLAVSGTFSVGGKSIIDMIYPIGSIYMSVNSSSPVTLFGGSWERLKDRFLLGAGDTYSAGKTGGASTVTLTVDQIPNHRHEANSIGFATGSSTSESANEVMRSATKSNSYGQTTYTTYTGGGKAHDNMPPYLAVYIWKRTA